MRKLWLMICCCLLLVGCQKNEPESKTPSFDFLQRITLEDLNQRISKNEPMFVYFGWTKNSQECIKLQENYLEPNIEYYSWNGLITVVDLDEVLPDALNDKSARQVLIDKYGIQYAPAFVFFYEGKVKSVIEWSPEESDVETGIAADQLNEWMRSVSLIR